MKIAARIADTLTRLAASALTVGIAPREQAAAAPAVERKPAPKRAPLVSVKGEVPTVEDIELAAWEYEDARTDANAAARLKRKAEKVLKRVPDGRYGAVTVERFESSRQTADLDEIRRIFAAHGLGEIPMKTCSPSLKVTFADQAQATTNPAAALAA